MPYLRLGRGEKKVVMIPGAGDGLRTVQDAALQLAWFYRRRRDAFTTLFISRRTPLSSEHDAQQHAADYLEVIERFGWSDFVLECNSAGGPVGQVLAARHPELVGGLVLASTAHRFEGEARRVIEDWLRMLQADQWGDFGWDTAAKTYLSVNILSRLAPLLKPLLAKVSRPRHGTERIVSLLQGLLKVDNTTLLPEIVCPTLVFAGERDPILGPEVEREMASLIPRSRLHLAEGYLHGADLESPEYAPSFAEFVRSV